MVGSGLSRFFPRSTSAAEPPVEDRSLPHSNVDTALDEKELSKEGTVLSTSVDSNAEFEDPSLAPGELSYDEGMCNPTIYWLRPN